MIFVAVIEREDVEETEDEEENDTLRLEEADVIRDADLEPD